jgi:(2Fe-2S) ferredoxin
MSDTGHCRFKCSLRQYADERWYVVVSIWDNGAAAGKPTHEAAGPSGGLDTEEEALGYYYEKVKPTIDKMIAAAEANGADIERKISTLLH